MRPSLLVPLLTHAISLQDTSLDFIYREPRRLQRAGKKFSRPQENCSSVFLYNNEPGPNKGQEKALWGCGYGSNRTSKAPSSKRVGYRQHWEDGKDSIWKCVCVCVYTLSACLSVHQPGDFDVLVPNTSRWKTTIKDR